jgi:hypothetical protein
VRDLDGRVLDAVDDAEGGHQLARGMHRNLELASRHFADLLGEDLRAPEDGVERAREARGDAPANARLGVDDGGRRAGRQDACEAGFPDE